MLKASSKLRGDGDPTPTAGEAAISCAAGVTQEEDPGLSPTPPASGRADTPRGASGRARAAISDAMVGLLHRHFGKGPTRAKTYLLDDYVLCVLQELLTTSEQTLVDRGRGDLVREYRLAFQEELAGEFRQAVEHATGRRVIAYHSQVVFDPPTGFEIFVLEPDHP